MSKEKEKDYEEYLLKHNPKRVATMFCNDCNEVVRMDRLKFHNCPKEKEKGLKLGFNLDKKEIERRVNERIAREPLYILGKTDGLKEGREGLIKEIEKEFHFSGIHPYLMVIPKKEWEDFKNG